MKIILISLILILIYYTLFKKSCECEEFEDDNKLKRKSMFNEIIELAKKISSKSNVKEDNYDKSYINRLLNLSNSDNKNINLSNSDNKNINNSNMVVKTNNNPKNMVVKTNNPNNIVVKTLSDAQKGQLFLNKLLAERNKSRAEMEIASEKLFGKVLQNSVIDSSYDDKFKVNSDLGSLEKVLPVLENKDKNGKIQLDKLPYCKVPIKINLLSNYNHIINSGNEIYQDILKPNSNKIDIHNLRHSLIQIVWTKSSLQWYGENIELEIRFVCLNPDNGLRVHIVFPLKLVDTYMKIENFSDTYFNLGLNEFNHNPSNKISDVKKGIMFPVLEDKLNTLTKDLTNKHIISLDNKIKILDETNKKLNSNLKIEKPIFKVNGEQIFDKDLLDKVNKETNKSIIQNTKKVNDIKLHKENIIKNPIQDNAMIIELKKNSDLNVNQINNGMTSAYKLGDLKKNKTFNKQNVFHSESAVKKILKNFAIKKIKMSTIPKSVNLNDLKKKLESTNFNFVTKEIKNVKYSYSDIDTLLNLNSLIVDTSIIPDYMCCKPTIGQLVNIDFCQIQSKLLAQDLFYFTHANDGSLIFITEPHPYEKKIGNAILQNII